MYSEDTFFHLTTQERIGLVIISLILFAFTVGVFWKISSRFNLLVKVLCAIVFIWIFIWLSPQVYYLYYIQIFDDLPYQNVIQNPSSITEILKTITFFGNNNLSNHAKGIVFWAMIIVALGPSSKKNEISSNKD